MTRVLCVLGALVTLSASPVAAADPGPVYANCSEARADGATNIPKDDPAYWEDGDRDGDGIACESQ